MAAKNKALASPDVGPVEPTGKIIDLDALLSTPDPVMLGGRVFLGREFTVMEREQYVRSETGNDTKAQRELTAEFLNRRIGDEGEPVTPEWVGERTPRQLVQLVRYLLGLPLTPGGQGNE